MKKSIITLGMLMLASGTLLAQDDPEATTAKEKDIKQEVYSWRLTQPFGAREYVAMDTLPENYAQQFVPTSVSPAYATTGNYGAPGETMLYFDRKPMSDFFFRDALEAWLPTFSKQRFFNSHIPLTLVSYSTGGNKMNSQDRLKTIFSGNINSKAQIGAMFDYLYSKGSYDKQAVKGLMWGVSGSYIGDRYEMEAFYNHWNTLGKNNGGITNDLYITDPAEVQGGQTTVEPKAIPTRLDNAHSRLVGGQFYMTNAYKVGFWKEEDINDSTTISTYVPVTKFHWILDYRTGRHTFHDTKEPDDFWAHTYLSLDESNDRTTYSSVKNTVAITLLEEFNKFARFGLTGFASHEYRSYTQATDTIDQLPVLPEGLTPYPVDKVPHSASENFVWVGGRLSKELGSILTYQATAKFGLIGRGVGDLDIDGRIGTKFKLLGDSVSIIARGQFKNEAAPYLMNHYVSNHFIWDNDFGKTRSLRLGGELDIPHTNTKLTVDVENAQNMLYFNEQCLPTQYGGSVQIVGANLHQRFDLRALHWENRVTYQTSSNETVLPLPKLAVYSNLYVTFKIAKVLSVQLGTDVDYYTSYRAVDYQPATMTFYNQREIKCGNYPFMNAYANFKLSKTRFYIMCSHVNQGLTGNNYFSMPHYPLNPRRFQFGLSVDFTN